MPNKLFQFWLELKRRNVIRVITVYAGAAFVIIELVNNITEPLSLPEWTPTLIIILLLIGFPIAAIFSWIYDFHPKDGMIKTELTDKIQSENTSKSLNSWKIASYISFAVILGLIVLNIVQQSGKKEISDKSIAVLPFRNESSDEENTYFINGVMEAILDNLCKIEDLRVPGRTSVEQYRDAAKPIPVIAEEMNVGYILEGSGQKIGNRTLLSVQLLDGKRDKHLWSKQYDRQIHSVEELIDIQSEVAVLVAAEIRAIIKPGEKQLMKNIPTTNLAAYEFYKKGMEKLWDFRLDNDNLIALNSAEELFNYALESDSSFAQPYVGLAQFMWYKYYGETYFSETFLDSVLILINKAILHDPQLSEAYTLRGFVFRETGNSKRALEDYSKAVKLNPNDWQAYRGLGYYYMNYDLVKSVENFSHAISLHRGPLYPDLLNGLGVSLVFAGFEEEPIKCFQEAMSLTGDSTYALIWTSWTYFLHADFEKALENAELAYSIDSTDITTLLRLGWTHLRIGNKEEALKFYKRWYDRAAESDQGSLWQTFRMALAYWENGLIKEAEYYFDQQESYMKREKELGRLHDELLYNYHDLAAIQAFRGEKKDALENLRIFAERQQMSFFVPALIEIEPFFDQVKDDPGFREIFQEIKAKYQAEHEMVRQWLDENDMY